MLVTIAGAYPDMEETNGKPKFQHQRRFRAYLGMEETNGIAKTPTRNEIWGVSEGQSPFLFTHCTVS